MSNSRVMRWITGSLEAILGIPVLGGLLVISTWYVPLAVMLILHIITLILTSKNKEPIYGSVVGVVTSLVAWIPIVGMIMHIISAVLLMVSAAKPTRSAEPVEQETSPA